MSYSVVDTGVNGLTAEDIDRMNSVIRPFPLPDHLTPSGTCDFSSIPEDVLLNTPPHLLVHLQRTAAQGGMQVVSPRQTPMSALMCRIKSNTRHRGDHIVGSIADVGDAWPTVDNSSFSSLLPDEPLPPRVSAPAIRKKTKTMSLTTATHMMRDPILACLVKGRAVIDILNRPDVQGDGRAVLTLLADAWGISEDSLMDLDAFTLGYEGDLLRHAIRVDDVYPVMYAPIHQRRAISVGTSEVSREDLPADSAIDWRRLRVFCEAVFSLSMSIEGISLVDARCVPPPGDTSVPANRPFTLAFLPAPCTAWTYAPSTFALSPLVDKKVGKMKTIPPEVLLALTRYVAVVNPMSYAMTMGFKARTRQTHMTPVEMAAGETLSSNYGLVARSVVTTGARGRSAAAAVRSFIFQILENCPPVIAMRLNRYIQIAQKEVMVHLKTRDIPDRMIDRLADRFLDVGQTIRLKVVEESLRRGSSAAEWWHDITAQTTVRYKSMKEGTMGWARVGMYLLFKQPTDKWRKLCSAINYNVMRDAAAKSVTAVALPAEKGSLRRLEAAARHVAEAVTVTYASYYMGVHDVGLAMSDELADMGKERTSNILRHAAYLWALRARVFRAINVTVQAVGNQPKKPSHYVAAGDNVAINLAPAPYKAYAAYRIGVMKDATIPTRVKNLLPAKYDGQVSDVFKAMRGPLFPCPESELTRYLHSPQTLGVDMESAWAMLVSDMEEVIKVHGPAPVVVPPPAPVVAANLAPLSLSIHRIDHAHGARRSYWDTIGYLSGEATDLVDSLMAKVGPANEDMIMEEDFADTNELILRLKGIVASVEALRETRKETVA